MNEWWLDIYSVINDNGHHGRDLLISSPDGPQRIDCGPKLANLRRYWRDYYVEPGSTMASTSSSSSSSTSSEAVAHVNMEEMNSKVSVNKKRVPLKSRTFFNS